MIFNKLHAATWGDVGKAKEKGFFDFDIFSWMAWTWQTASFFIFIALCITVMLIWEKYSPGGNPTKGNFRIRHNKRRQTFCFFIRKCIYTFGVAWSSRQHVVDSNNYLCCLFRTSV